ncbi:AI-2E family transporter [Alkalihalophilus pseudofirmus]|uniref:AI-2E family transporter n=1 Tax=Alkalihalophilus pseudofirmus TaxID=79885 RepID=UPI00259B31DE|nr:AI-2E family transporter [Alkalihalophilus pseudofirmus]WEG18904.1 AI-2E family transporter [Alkalihalophilus pseudofirmus]
MYKKAMKIGSLIIVIFVIIYLGSLISWVFSPLVVFVQTLFIPILLAGVLYYLLRPLVTLLNKKMPRALAILLLYLGVLALGTSIISFMGPEIQKQFTALTFSMPSIVAELQLLITNIQQIDFLWFDLSEIINVEDYIEQIGLWVGGLVGDLFTRSVGFIGTVLNALLLLFIVPFILFYLLKEGERLPKFFLHFLTKDKQEEIKPILTNMDKTLSSYIQGVLIVCSFIGILYYIGFTSIGLEYALVLAIFGMITNVIPYLGPWIGAIPSVIVALLHSPMMAVFVLFIVVVIQQIESIFVQPQIIGKKMSIHPVTVMALVLVAGRFVGIGGMILVIPIYAIGKVIVTHLYKLWKVKEEGRKSTV